VHRRRVLGVEGEDVADDDGGSLVSILWKQFYGRIYG
jgi:hypothetical protein